MIRPRLRAASLAIARPSPKRADPELLTPEHRAFREAVMINAGFACQGVLETGAICGRFNCRLFADHIVERQDGGKLFDPTNGQALCGSCHSRKTAKERERRMSRRLPF